jgi:hypothetical protein
MVDGMDTLPESHFVHYEGTRDPRDCAKGSSEYTCTQPGARYRPRGGGNQVKSLCCMSLMKVMDILARMGYDEVLLLGFDGFSKPYHYFYQDPAFYPEEAKAWREAVEAGLKVRGKPLTGWSMDTGGNVFEEKTTGKKKHGKNGYEEALAAFAVFNGMRLVNLNPESTLNGFVYTRNIEETTQALEHDPPAEGVLNLVASPPASG